MLVAKVLYILKALRFILYPLYLLSFFIPRKDNIWVFGAHHNRFSENTKALFLYSSKHNKAIHSVWITGNKKLAQKLRKQGYISYTRWSIKGFYISLRAKYYFYNVYSDDINFYTSANAILVNLWHGIPLKQIEFDIKTGPLKKMFNSRYSLIYAFFKPYIFKSPNYILSTSKSVSKIFSSSFKVDTSQCLELGYPRTDSFFSDIKENNSLDYNTNDIYSELNSLIELKKQKIFIYMPTWRSNKKDFIDEAIPNFKKLNNILISKNYSIVIKLHPNDTTKRENHSNIIFINPKIDIYKLLPLSEYLITDYSSIYFDYLLLDKEIIFYAFDLDSYLNQDRELYFDYIEKTPGQKVYNFEDLLSLLSNSEVLNFKEERSKIKDEFWVYQDGNASERIFNYFNNRVPK